MAAATDHLGGLDVLVNNAGISVTARLIDTDGGMTAGYLQRERAPELPG